VSRRGQVVRETRETKVTVDLDLDGTGTYDVRTPMPFLTHMVEQLARHSGVDLTLEATGDVHVDGHHTSEDVGIAIGQAVARALGDRAGIRRYGSATLPMDEALVTVAVDLSGRPYFVAAPSLAKGKVGDFDSELCDVVFEGFARGAAANLHVVRHRGENLHHQIEVAFKALARALSQAIERDVRAPGVPSTKGTLTSG
jgi:imidazoleglycerol-phosphate dehydratase